MQIIKVTTFFILIQISFFCNGQLQSKNVDVHWGSEQRTSKHHNLNSIVGYDYTGIYTLEEYIYFLPFLNSSRIRHYNNNLDNPKSKGLDLKRMLKKKDLHSIDHINNQLFVFSTYKNNTDKQNILYVQSINKGTLRPKDDLRAIASISYSGNFKFNAGSFTKVISRDSSKVLVYYELPYNKGEKEKYGFIVFDNNLNKLWDKEITLPFKDELFESNDYMIDNLGNIHILCSIYKDKRKLTRNGSPNYTYRLISYYNQASETIEYPIELKDLYITDMQIANNKNQDIICAGFYSAEGTSSIKGSYFLKINGKTKKIESTKTKDFDIDFITQDLTLRQEKKAKRKMEKGKNIELYEYDLDDIILKDDGGAYLVGEQYYIQEIVHTTMGPNGAVQTYYTYQYNFNDIIVINFNEIGDIEWAQKIPKRQITSNDLGYYSSYALSVTNNKLYFIFNDNPKNLKYNGNGKPYNFSKGKNAYVSLIEMDNNGNQKRESLFSPASSGYLARPMVCRQVSDSEMIFFGKRKKAQRFAKIVFNN